MNFFNAVNDVSMGLLSNQDSAVKYRVSKSTVSRKVLHKNNSTVGHPTAFSNSEETAIVKHLIAIGEWGFPMNLLNLRLLGKLYLDQAGRKVKSFRDNISGKDWARGFILRNSAQLTCREGQKTKAARSKVDAVTINIYFDNLADSPNDVPASQILNYDETNLSDNPRASKYIFR